MWRRFFTQGPPDLAPAHHAWTLSAPVLQVSQSDWLRLSDLYTGVQIFGGTGSGKSSGSCMALALALLQRGAGFLVLCAKTDEADTWRWYAELAGRSDDLIVFGKGQPWRFNFLNYEMTNGSGAGETENMVALLGAISEQVDRKQGQSNTNDPFWPLAGKRMQRAAVNLLKHGLGEVSIAWLRKVIMSAPLTPEMVENPQWQATSQLWAAIEAGRERLDAMTPSDRTDFQDAVNYWLYSYPRLGDRTQSSITETVLAGIDVFGQGMLRELFSTTTNVTPDCVLDGRILVIDLPIKEFHEGGQYAAVVWKYLTQRCIERRPKKPNARPAVVYVDESHLFAGSYDAIFQSTARSSCACTIYATQSYSAYLKAMGGDQMRSEVDSLLTNLQVKIFHQSSDSVTNQWAADLIGRGYTWLRKTDMSYQPQGWIDELVGMRDAPGTSSGVSESLQYLVEPATFTTLSSGGYAYGGLIEAIIYGNGRIWNESGASYLRTTFRQHFKPRKENGHATR
jgi:hypothetical protein